MSGCPHVPTTESGELCTLDVRLQAQPRGSGALGLPGFAPGIGAAWGLSGRPPGPGACASLLLVPRSCVLFIYYFHLRSCL